MTRAGRVVERFAPWLAALAVAAPVLAYRYPPMLDLPNHEEIVAAVRHAADASRYPTGLFAWNIGYPNQLFYFIAGALAFVVPVDLACKIVVAASAAAVPLGAARLADHVGVSRWSAVPAAALALGFFFYFGFVGNLMAFGALLASLPLVDAFAGAPTIRRTAALVALLVALFFAHESALVVACIALAVLALARASTARDVLRRAAPIPAAALVVFAAHARGSRASPPNLRGLPLTMDLSFDQKLDGLPQALLGLHGSRTTVPAFVALAAVLALIVVDRVRHRAPSSSSAPPGARARLEQHRFELLGAVLAVFYFEFPFAIQGAMWLHARFAGPAAAVLLVSLAPRGAPLSLFTRAASIAAVGVALALVRPAFEATGAVYRDLDPLLERIEPGSAVAYLDPIGPPLRSLVFTVGGATARAPAVRGGRAAATFVQMSPSPPRVVAQPARWDGIIQRLSRDGLGLAPSFDLRRFRYVLAWTAGASVDPLSRALAPEARLVATSGGWSLFESNLPIDALTAPEPAFDGAETVRQRIERK